MSERQASVTPTYWRPRASLSRRSKIFTPADSRRGWKPDQSAVIVPISTRASSARDRGLDLRLVVGDRGEDPEAQAQHRDRDDEVQRDERPAGAAEPLEPAPLVRRKLGLDQLVGGVVVKKAHLEEAERRRRSLGPITMCRDRLIVLHPSPPLHFILTTQELMSGPADPQPPQAVLAWSRFAARLLAARPALAAEVEQAAGGTWHAGAMREFLAARDTDDDARLARAVCAAARRACGCACRARSRRARAARGGGRAA